MNARHWIALAIAAAPLVAAACGVCIDDRVAATYDHAVAEQAARRHHVVVFASIAAGAEARAVAREVHRVAGGVPGVDRGSVRTAVEPLGVSFALDPRTASVDATLATIAERMRVPGSRLTLLRVLPAPRSD